MCTDKQAQKNRPKPVFWKAVAAGAAQGGGSVGLGLALGGLAGLFLLLTLERLGVDGVELFAEVVAEDREVAHTVHDLGIRHLPARLTLSPARPPLAEPDLAPASTPRSTLQVL